MPQDDEMPADDDSFKEPDMGEEPMDTKPTGEEPEDTKPFDDEPFDAGVEADEDTDPKKFIEQLTGKLGQSLRNYTEERGEPDFKLEKFAINSLLSATHTSEMDERDRRDIIKKVKKAGEPKNDTSSENQGEEEIETEKEEELDENMYIGTPKRMSIFAPEGSEEHEYQKNVSKSMHEESNNYMFWQNLKTMRESIGHLLEMDCDKVDALLSDGHGWALDHIATSTDDVEEVYHFISNSLSEDRMYDDSHYEEWGKPMEMHGNYDVSDDLSYHIENKIPLGESIFRFGSEKFINLVNEVKALYAKNLIKLNENDVFIVTEFDNDYIKIGDKLVKLNLIMEDVEPLNEAEYRGKKVQLNRPKRGGSKKFYVYVKDPKSGNIKKVSFGAKSGGGKLSVKLKDPKARKAFSDRHNCPQKKDKTSAGYWACRLPRYAKLLGLSGGGTYW
jgi:hypothetical protein